jgi:hypothetical protein
MQRVGLSRFLALARTSGYEHIPNFAAVGQGRHCDDGRRYICRAERDRAAIQPRLALAQDRLVLHGIERAEGTALADELRGQVIGELSARRGFSGSRRTPVVKLGMNLEPGLGGARKLGSGMARAIGKSLKP